MAEERKMLSKAQVKERMRQLAEDKKKLEEENKELKGINIELRKSNKKHEIEYGNLREKYEELNLIAGDLVSEQYLSLQERLHEIKICRPYEVFFEHIVPSLQKLLGFAEGAGMLAAQKQEYYMWEVIADPIIETVRNMGGEIKQGMLSLPEETGAFDREGMKEGIKGEALAELGRYIREDGLEERQGKIALQKKAIVQKLGNLISELEKMDRNLPVDEEKVKRLALETRIILEAHAIYPMFANDSRLEGCRGLQRRFSSPNAYSIRYPGFYIQREGVWEVLGAHIGMDLAGIGSSED